jgi:hypothetical protein
LHSLYQSGELSFIANIGQLVEPLTVAEFRDRNSIKKKPPGIGAHNIAQRAAQNLHAQETNAKVRRPFLAFFFSLFF